MKNWRKEFKRNIRFNSLYVFPVFSGALGINVPILVATSLQNGMILSVIFSIMLISVCLISSLCFAYLPKHVRMIAVVLTASICFFAAVFVAKQIWSQADQMYSIYAPLLIVSSLLIDRAERVAVQQKAWVATVDAAACAIGFSMMCSLTGAVRELLGNGTLYGAVITPAMVPNRLATTPLFGFLVLGFLAAIAKGLRIRLEKKN